MTSDDPAALTRLAYERDAAEWMRAAGAVDRSAWDSYGMFARAMRSGGLVLDLGCGAGFDAPELSARGYRLVGLDPVEVFLKHAISGPSFAGRAVLGDMRALPFADAVFDGVWAVRSIHHVPKTEVRNVLVQVARILQPRGVIYASVERGRGEAFATPDADVVHPRYYAYYEADELAAVVRAAGFEVIESMVGEPGPRSEGFIALTARKG